MRILLTTPRLNPTIGGPAHSVSAIGRNLTQKGVVTRWLTTDRRQFSPPGQSLTWRDLGDLDVVHNFGMWTPFNHLVSRGARVAGLPYILAPVGMLEPWAMSQQATKKRAGFWCYQANDLARACVIHATAESEAQSIRALGVTTPLAIMPHGVDIPSEVTEFDGAADEARPRVALFMSRIHPKKGLLNLVEAWARLRPKGWKVVVAGPDEGGHRAVVEQLIAHHSLHASFSFLGPVHGEAKRKLLRSADLFVLPTYSENFGLVVTEALSEGLPVITTHGAPWEELSREACGWWIPTGPDALTEVLSGVVQMDRSELRAYGARGKALVQRRYSWPQVIERHMAVYRWICGSGPKPGFVLD